MRFAVLGLLVLVAGCVAAPEQRWVVQVRHAEGAAVWVPVPLDTAQEIPTFAKAAEFVEGRATFSFLETEHGPGVRIEVPRGGGDHVVFSARQPGATDLALSTTENETAWMWSDREGVEASVVLGDTTLPDCSETLVEAAWGAPGWLELPLLLSSHCP